MIDDEHVQDGFERRKQEALDDAARRRRNLLIVMPLVIGAVLLLRQLGLLTRDLPPIAPLETLTLTSSTQTQNSYDGALELAFSGVIVSADGERDAFYVYAAAQAAWVLAPPILADLTDDAPPFNADHVYRVPYNVGDTPRPLRFTLPDGVISSTLRVEIARQP